MSGTFAQKQGSGIPNIIGRVSAYRQWDTQTGAFYAGGYTGNTRVKYETGSGYELNFNAARYNPIYGAANEVRPQSVCYLPIIKYLAAN